MVSNNVIKIRLLYIAMLLGYISVAIQNISFIIIPHVISQIFSILSVLIFLYIIFSKRFNKFQFILITLCIVLAFISSLYIQTYSILLTVLSIIALSKDIKQKNIDSVLKVYEILTLFLLILCIFGSLITRNNLYLYDGTIKRYYFGLTHPNTFTIYTLNLVLIHYYRSSDKNSLINQILILIEILIMYLLTKTDSLILIILILSISWIFHNMRYYKKTVSLIIKFGVPVFSVINLFLIAKYQKLGLDYYFKFTTISTFLIRIKEGAYYFQKYGISLLGVRNFSDSIVYDNVWQLNTIRLDSFYISCLIHIGFVWLVVLSILFYRLSKIDDFKTNNVILLWMIYSLVESYTYNVYIFFPLLLISTVMYKKRTEKTIKFL